MPRSSLTISRPQLMPVVILVTAVMIQASTQLVALILLAVAVVMVVLPSVLAGLSSGPGARRHGRRARPGTATPQADRS